jgi:NADP-dependent 3-hydroxy acid dehydrogenase YdfG
MEIKDKVIIITGASQGIGEAAAKLLSEKGAKVVLAARSENTLNELAKLLPEALAIVTDMRKIEDIKKLVDKTMEKYGRIDILINNAGQGMYGPVETINVSQYKNLTDLNVYGVLQAMQLVIPIMRSQGGGMILNVSSGVTKMYIPNLSAYSSTKYALNAISLIARQELEKDKIIVSVIHPGMTATNFYKNVVGNIPSDWVEEEWPQMDTSEKVAGKIAELIKLEAAELEV